MASIKLAYNDVSAKQMAAKVRRAMSPQMQHRTVQRAARVWRTRMILRTPKRWTGQTRRGWVIRDHGGGVVELTNISKTMLFLERGTRAHGPKKAKALFIPLTRRAAMAGPRGVMAANRAAAGASQWANYGSGVTGKGKKKKKRRLPFVPGKDFIFAKRVKGIRARWIVRDARPFARASFRRMMIEAVRRAINS